MNCPLCGVSAVDLPRRYAITVDDVEALTYVCDPCGDRLRIPMGDPAIENPADIHVIAAATTIERRFLR